MENWTGDRVKDIEKPISPTGLANQMYQVEKIEERGFKKRFIKKSARKGKKQDRTG